MKPLVSALVITLAMGSAPLYSQTTVLKFTSAAVAAGDGPRAAVLFDLNRDGNRDLAVVSLFDSTISLILGDGMGTFTRLRNVDVTQLAPHGIATGDFNEDGILDLVTANRDSNTMGLFLADGQGGLRDPTIFATGKGPRWIAVADFNEDNHADLAITNRDDDNVTIMLGDGLGGFRSAAAVASGDGPVPVLAADLDNDGFIDLAVGNDIGDTLVVLLGDGEGQFTASAPVSVADAPKNIAIGDLNQDGLSDLAVAGVLGEAVTVLFADGDGGFTTTTYPAGAAPFAVVIEDFDGDGISDMAVGDGVNDSVLILLNQGSGVFAPAQSFPAGLAPHDLLSDDFNGDGRPDLAVVNTGDDNVTILLNETPMATSVHEVAVIQQLYSSFFPDPVIAIVGQPLRLMFTTQAREHVNRLQVLPWINATDLIRVGEILSVEFTPEQTGNFLIRNIGHGFTGDLIIVEDAEALDDKVRELERQDVSLIHSAATSQIFPSSIRVLKDIPTNIYNISLDESHRVSILPWLLAPTSRVGNVVARSITTFQFVPTEAGRYDIHHTVHGFTGSLIVEGPPPLSLSVKLIEEKVEVNWERGILQTANEINGSWLDVVDAIIPYAIVPEGSKAFFRLRE